MGKGGMAEVDRGGVGQGGGGSGRRGRGGSTHLNGVGGRGDNAVRRGLG